MDRKIVEFLMAGKGVQKVASALKIGKVRVRTVRKKAEVAGYLSQLIPLPDYPLPLFPDEVDRRSFRSSEPDQVLLAHRAWIEGSLQIGWKPITIFEELKIPEISRASFYRFLDRHGLDRLADEIEKESLIPPIFHSAGETLILDWGKLRDVIDPTTGKKRTLWAFVGVLGFSRYMMIRLVWSNDVSTTLGAIESMLRELGGVPKRLTSDNPKCFATQADFYDPLLNPALMRFAQHYKFTMECLPPRDPKKKGKVERLMPFARRLFEAHPQEWSSLEHAQDYLDKKVNLANQRIHGTTRLKPFVVFLEKEASSLKPLPALSYEPEEVSYPQVRKDGFVRVANKYYAVDEKYIQQETMVLSTKKQISIYCQGKLLEVYDRIENSYETHAMKEYLKKPWQKFEENNRHYLQQAEKIGPNAEAFVRAVLYRGNGFVDTRIIWGFLCLNKTYAPCKIDQAAADALAEGKLSSRFVQALLKDEEQKSIPHPSLSSTTAEKNYHSKFLRPMSVYTEQLGLLN